MGVRAPWVVVGAQLELHSTPELDPRLGCAAWVGTAAVTAGVGALMGSWPETAQGGTPKTPPASSPPAGAGTPPAGLHRQWFSRTRRAGDRTHKAFAGTSRRPP